MSSVFNNLASVDVSKMTEQKKNLTYLTWTHAWAEVKKKYPQATYEILKFDNNLPYVYDNNTGYMVFTTVTIEGLTHEMWLLVMDGANKAMKAEPYKYKTRNGDRSVEAATMFDINKTIMRCLTKNLAMHGLGLHIYAGEDLPLVEEPVEGLSKEAIDIIEERFSQESISIALKAKGVSSLTEIPASSESGLVSYLEKKDIEKTIAMIEDIFGELEYVDQARGNSIKKNLGVDMLSQCNDLDKLTHYYYYLETKKEEK